MTDKQIAELNDKVTALKVGDTVMMTLDDTYSFTSFGNNNIVFKGWINGYKYLLTADTRLSTVEKS